ncbi:MAG: DUF885 domain-containing protein [Candidatus Zixiibacteriota bacterium]|nr:MAG: DUF885 domain-containing protein [candidate division Zixibacteria bacterium]
MRLLICFGLLTVLTMSPLSPASARTQSLAEVANEILETLQSFYPVLSTRMGIHAYDHRFTDYSKKSVDQVLDKLSGYEKKLYKYKAADLPLYDRINYRLLKSNVDMAILDLKRIKWHRKSPELYARELVDGIYFLMMFNDAPLEQRLVSIINRMESVPAYIATARKNLRKPPPVYIEAAAQTLESGILLYKDVAAELSNKFPGRADELSRVSTRAREAMNDFAAFLGNIEPGNEKDFAIGKDNFDYRLKHEYFLEYDSDSLLKLGEALFASADSTYREYLQYVEDNQNGTDSVFVPANFTKQDILDYYNWEVEQLKIFVEENDIVTVPEDIAPLLVIETPPFLRTMVSGIAYEPPGPFNAAQPGYFYVRPIPDDLDRPQLEARYRYVHRRGFKGAVVHEAYPGHHLQMQLAAAHRDPVRKWQLNPMIIEGWGLYCEEMMYEQGLYGHEDAAKWLDVLDGIRFRAARIVADVKLHTGRFTYDECVRWMTEALDFVTNSDLEFIRVEVRRYTTTPTYQMSYLIGKLEIIQLLEAASEREGQAFDLRSFHDILLAEGAIAPALMWEIMDL